MDGGENMEDIKAGVPSSNEGAGTQRAVQEDLQESHVEYGNGNSAPEESAVPEEQPPQLTAEELAKLPPELRPGPDGRPPKITPKLLKQMRGHYFTVKHDVLTNCGHKMDRMNQPHNNCENCWYQFFNTHPQLVEVSDQFFRTHGKGPLIGMRGEKYFKNFVRFMATVIHFQKEELAVAAAKAAKEQADVASSQERVGNTGGTAGPEEGVSTDDCCIENGKVTFTPCALEVGQAESD
jgi:hypothetical protein